MNCFSHPVYVLGVNAESRARDPAVLCPVCKGKVNDGDGKKSHPQRSANFAESPVRASTPVRTKDSKEGCRKVLTVNLGASVRHQLYLNVSIG